MGESNTARSDVASKQLDVMNAQEAETRFFEREEYC